MDKPSTNPVQDDNNHPETITDYTDEELAELEQWLVDNLRTQETAPLPDFITKERDND